MPKEIEDYIIQFSGKTFSNSEDALDYWRKALQDNTEAVIKAMIVEEREIKREDYAFESMFEVQERIAEGHNQCRAIQLENAEKLRNKEPMIKDILFLLFVIILVSVVASCIVYTLTEQSQPTNLPHIIPIDHTDKSIEYIKGWEDGVNAIYEEYLK